jgi:hypothetical protein
MCRSKSRSIATPGASDHLTTPSTSTPTIGGWVTTAKKPLALRSRLSLTTSDATRNNYAASNDEPAAAQAETSAPSGICTTPRLAGQSYDNAEAESLIGPTRPNAPKREGPWRGVDDLELATLSWVHWFNPEPALADAAGPACSGSSQVPGASRRSEGA